MNHGPSCSTRTGWGSASRKSGPFTPHPLTALGREVQNVRESIRDLVKNGVAFQQFNIPGFLQDEMGIWTADDGMQVAWFKDPDGTSCR